jgi:hypothetical protein
MGANIDNSIVERAFDCAKKAEEFAGIIETLKPHVTNIASWLGYN